VINNLLTDGLLYKQLQENCLKMRQEWNWEKEEKELLAIYHSIEGPGVSS
jgi:hypothetical protein